nr:GrpB family protein [Kineococcus vitellinus]
MRPYDPDWPVRAARLLSAAERALAPLEVVDALEHIGSTSVPGLAAKDYVDLQVRVRELPEPGGDFDEALASIGFVPAVGARPDSPGVHRDVPRGSEVVPDELWCKRLFVHDVDGPRAAILHVRSSASPWARYTVWFRDWLRAHPAARDRYASFKAGAAAEHAGDADFDDYTRAKAAFFDEVQEQFEAWGRSR